MSKQAYSGRLTLKSDQTCTGCSKMLPAGSVAWYSRGGRGGARCIDCGPHPGHQVPSRFRPLGIKSVGTLVAGDDVDALPSERTMELAALQSAVAVLQHQVANLRSVNVVEIRNRDAVKTIEGSHKKLPAMLRLAGAGIGNIYLVGPAGSGKTTLAEQFANALGLPFGFLSLSGGVNETHLLGRVLPQADGSWQYVPSQFVRVYEEGGVFLLDEVDAADPNVMVTINAALANGQLANPISGTVHKRHANTVIVCAANTFGTGADAQYVGRNALDAATLDRFVGAMIEVDYDRDVERTIARNACGASSDELLSWAWGLRERVQGARMRRIVGTRLIKTSANLLGAGYTMDEVRTACFVGWTADELRKVS